LGDPRRRTEDYPSRPITADAWDGEGEEKQTKNADAIAEAFPLARMATFTGRLASHVNRNRRGYRQSRPPGSGQNIAVDPPLFRGNEEGGGGKKKGKAGNPMVHLDHSLNRAEQFGGWLSGRMVQEDAWPFDPVRKDFKD